MTEFVGVVWDNDRATRPLFGTLAAWAETYAGSMIRWERRPLETFAHQPISELTDRFDLIILDHPHIGEAAEMNSILPVDQLVEDVSSYRETVGPTFQSYLWSGSLWALPLDAACQVAARRPDLCPTSELPQVSDWDQVTDWARLHPFCLGLPFVPVLALMSLYTICANLGGEPGGQQGHFVEKEIGVEALEVLRELASLSHPGTLNTNDVGTLELMSTENSIHFVPLIFGYFNYARDGYRTHRVTFEGIPSHTGVPRGSILGGAGIAISAHCKYPAKAAEYCGWLASDEIQTGLHADRWGQPAAKAAWSSDRVNAITANSYRNSRETIEAAYVRPRHKGYISFQEVAGQVVREGVLRGETSVSILETLDLLFRISHGLSA